MNIEEVVEETIMQIEDLLALVRDMLPHSDIENELETILEKLNDCIGFNE